MVLFFFNWFWWVFLCCFGFVICFCLLMFCVCLVGVFVLAVFGFVCLGFWRLWFIGVWCCPCWGGEWSLAVCAFVECLVKCLLFCVRISVLSLSELYKIVFLIFCILLHVCFWFSLNYVGLFAFVYIGCGFTIYNLKTVYVGVRWHAFAIIFAYFFVFYI